MFVLPAFLRAAAGLVNQLPAVLLRRRVFAAVEIFFEKLLFSRVSCKSVCYAVNPSRQNQEYDVEIREERDNKRSRGNQVGLPVLSSCLKNLTIALTISTTTTA